MLTAIEKPDGFLNRGIGLTTGLQSSTGGQRLVSFTEQTESLSSAGQVVERRGGEALGSLDVSTGQEFFRPERGVPESMSTGVFISEPVVGVLLDLGDEGASEGSECVKVVALLGEATA